MDITKQKIKRTVIPFIIILLFYTDPIKIILGVKDFEFSETLLVRRLFLMYLGHLWFLPVLFIIFLLSYVPGKVSNDRFQFVFLSFLIILNVISTKLPQYFQISNIAHYFVYFYFGILINRWRLLDRLRKLPKRIAITIVFVLLGICLAVPIYLSAPLVICAIVLIYFITPERYYSSANLIATCSFVIYLLHSPLVYITYTYFNEYNPWLVLCINAIFFGGLALGFAYLLKLSRLRLIIGE